MKKIFVVGFSIVFFLGLIFFTLAATNTFNMYWSIPISWDENGTLILNFTLSDVESVQPNNICFALNNSVVCVDDAPRDLDLESLDLLNVSDLCDDVGD